MRGIVAVALLAAYSEALLISAETEMSKELREVSKLLSAPAVPVIEKEYVLPNRLDIAEDKLKSDVFVELEID